MRLLIAVFFLIGIIQSQEIVWVRSSVNYSYRGSSDLAVDSRNNAIVIAYPYLKKFDPNGEMIWEREINFGIWEVAVVVDKGDSIIAGGCNLRSQDTTWVIMKYSPAGESLWRREFIFPGGPVGSFCPVFTDLGIDTQNNILVAGYSTAADSWLTYKLSPQGDIKWIRIFTSNWGPNQPTGICADDSLNVIVGGNRGIVGVSRSWFPQVFKYSPNGDSLWAVYYRGNHHNHYVGELNVDRFGNILLPGGEMVDRPPGNTYAFLFKYDRQGNTLWQWFDDTTASTEFYSVSTDTVGNIYTTGARNPYDVTILEVRKFNPYGESLWTFHYPLWRRNISEMFFFEIELDQDGNIIVAANKDTFVYALKITEYPGIVEDKTEKINRDFISSTIITSKRNFKINLPSSITLVSIYNIAGKLIRKIRTGDDKVTILNTNDIQFLPESIYFIKTEGNNKGLIKVILLN
jgi:hypothetical protein